MMGKSHRRYGAIHGAVVGAASGVPPLAVAAFSLGGYACATWPDRIEKPLRLSHRCQSHNYVYPLIVTLIAAFLPAIIMYGILSVTLAWFSHLQGDWVFGKAHTRDNPHGGFTMMRPRGIPIPPFGYHGLGRKVDGRLEQWTCRAFGWSLPFIVGISLGYSLLRSVK